MRYVINDNIAQFTNSVLLRTKTKLKQNIRVQKISSGFATKISKFYETSDDIYLG